MRFLELLKRPDSGRRAMRNDPRSGINVNECVEVLFDAVAGFGVDSVGAGVVFEADGPRQADPSVPKVSSDP